MNKQMKCGLFITVLVNIWMVGLSQSQNNLTAFEKDILQLKEYFHIPGIAIGIKQGDSLIYENYLGWANIEDKVPVDSSTVFPIASITKTIMMVAFLQLVNEGAVDVEEAVIDYIPELNVPASVKIKHLISHTSEGTPGTTYIYSRRIGLLKTIIEEISGKTFLDFYKERIQDQLTLDHTFPMLSDSTVEQHREVLATPYFFYGSTEPGIYEPGFSTTAGLVSNIRDLMAFDFALDNHLLLPPELQGEMMRPVRSKDDQALPYGYGIFAQEFLTKKINWSYGQFDCFSSLYLKVPEQDLTLVLLANNNLMSDPARLINGDIRYSLFAMAFLKYMVFDIKHKIKFEGYANEDTLRPVINSLLKDEQRTAIDIDFYAQELAAQMLAAIFMAQGFPKEADKAYLCYKLIKEIGIEFTEFGNLSTLHGLIQLMTFYPEESIKADILSLGTSLTTQWPEDPYAKYYLALYHDIQGNEEKAYQYYQELSDLENHQPFWYTIEAYYYLGQYFIDRDVDKAKAYFRKIVSINWNIGGKVEAAKRALVEISEQEASN